MLREGSTDINILIQNTVPDHYKFHIPKLNHSQIKHNPHAAGIKPVKNPPLQGSDD